MHETLKNLDEIIHALTPVNTIPNETRHGETLYRFESLMQEIDSLQDEFIEVTECFITPNYYCPPKRYELYEYELSIVFEDQSFEDYLLQKTGRMNIRDVPQDIVTLHRECHIQLSCSVPKISKERMNRYFHFLYNSSHLIRQTLKVFNEFDPHFLAFTYYS